MSIFTWKSQSAEWTLSWVVSLPIMYFLCLTIKWCLTSDNLLCSHFECFFIVLSFHPFLIILPSLWGFHCLHLAYCAALSEPDLTTVIQGLCLYALGDIAAPDYNELVGLLVLASCHRLFCVLSLFFKSHGGRWNWQPFWFSGSFLDKKRLHWPLAYDTQDWRGHLTPFTSGGGPVSKPSWCPAPAACQLNSTSGSQESQEPERRVASYCSSLPNILPITVPWAEGRSKESSASIWEKL